MKSKTLEKIVNGFQTAGIIVAPFYMIISIAKDLPSISWANFVAHFMNILEIVVTTLGWLFIVWILHKFAMFGIHKLWPDVYDENGHMRKDKDG